MTNVQLNPNALNPKSKYDLEDRTLELSKRILDFVGKLPQNTITKPLISQLIRAGTSIGANYSEADEANSKKDFINKMVIAKKEIKETKYWLKLISYTLPEHKEESMGLFGEVQELNLIFAAIIRKSQIKTVGH